MVPGLVIVCVVLVIAFAVFMKLVEQKVQKVTYSDRVKDWKQKGHIFQWNSSGNNTHYNIFYKDSAPHEKRPILLLLHGFPTSSFDWYDIWDSLSERPWRVIAPDFLGFGFSDKPRSRKLYRDSIVLQADMVEDLIASLTETMRSSVYILAHDYGDSVAQELLHRHNHSTRENASRIKIKSICFLNGGMIPGVHRPIFIQKLLASPIGFIVGKFTNRSLFGSRFSSIFGRKPSEQELDEHWSIMSYNSGTSVQCYLIQYMDERMRNKDNWVNALRVANVPLCLIDGPYDSISGQHLAVAVADIWEIEPTPAENAPQSMGKRTVILLPQQFGHYPQLECPSMVLAHFYNFMESNFGRQILG